MRALLIVAAVLAVGFFVLAAVDPRAANDLVNFLDPNHP